MACYKSCFEGLCPEQVYLLLIAFAFVLAHLQREI